MLCLKNPYFAWEAAGLGVQLHLRSQAKKMHVLSFRHVLRRLFGNWAEPVGQWEDLAVGAAPWPMGAGLVPFLRQIPGEWSSQLQCYFILG